MTTLTLPNVQPAEKPDRTDDGSLDVVEVFSTMQGEGPHAGRPAVFVRLAGCNLQCRGCDTDYSAGRQRMTRDALLERVESLRKPPSLVVMTGGEPMRQKIGKIVAFLMWKGYEVQVETNGTLYQPDLPYWSRDFSVVCSPKTPKLNDAICQHLRYLKYVVEAGHTDPADGLPTRVLGMNFRVARPWPGFKGEVFIQPTDEQDADKNKANVQEAVRACLKYGYRLSLQTHKYLDLP